MAPKQNRPGTVAAPTTPPTAAPAPTAPAADAKPARKGPPPASWKNRTVAAMRHIETDVADSALKTAAALIAKWAVTLPDDYNAGVVSLMIGDMVNVEGYNTVLKALNLAGVAGKVTSEGRGWVAVTWDRPENMGGPFTINAKKTDCHRA